MIENGLVKGNQTSFCLSTAKHGVNLEDPCLICTSDAMCTKKDKETGEITHTFITKYKKEHRVMR